MEPSGVHQGFLDWPRLGNRRILAGRTLTLGARWTGITCGLDQSSITPTQSLSGLAYQQSFRP